MLGTRCQALLLTLRLSSVFAALSSWDAVYNVDGKVNRTFLRSVDRKSHNVALLHAKAHVDRHSDEPGDGMSAHGWTRSGHGPANVADNTGRSGTSSSHTKDESSSSSSSSSSKWLWGEESNADNANWGGPGYFGASTHTKPAWGEPAPAAQGAGKADAVALGAATSGKVGCAESITVQPSTRGQDEGTCGFLELPDRFFMRVKVAETMVMKGDWENDSGARYVEWTQDHFAWQYETVYFNTGDKLFMKTEVIMNEEVQLPGVQLRNARANEKKFRTMALKDCNDVLMYVLRESRSPPYLYEVFNRDDQLVAWSEFGSLHLDKVFWYDHLKKPIAVVQSPRLVENAYEVIEDREDPYFGNVPTWEIKYLKGYDPTAVLTIEQNRFVIAAAMQERAIRNAVRGPNGKPEAPEAFPWFVGLSIFALCVCIGAIAYCFYWIFRLVYPKSYKEVENKFLKHDKKIYGELVQGPLRL
jgi:hypothetical protein